MIPSRFRARRGRLAAAAATSVAVAVALPAGVAAAGPELGYRVTIVNVTSGNQFTPVLAAVHSPAAALFELGQPASEELATLAETGDTAPLEGLLGALDAVSSASTTAGPTNGLTFAGETVEFEIAASPYREVLSLAAMILPTNDAFVALDSVRLPRYGSRSWYAVGHDAGSEADDELCENIPGPTCGEDGPGGEGEGFVHVSSGIHGVGDLPEEIYDWRNPVAKVTVTRVR